jgi:uncharacterized protein involved in exopolysaccharide biosynthesis
MYDSRLKSSTDGRRSTAATVRVEALPIRPSEAELLRVIGKALEEQRLQRGAPPEPPLVDRIETILGTRLQAANDVRSPEEPSKPQAPSAVLYEIDDADLGTPPEHHVSLAKPLAAIAVAVMVGAAIPLLMPAGPAHYAAETAFHVQADSAERAAMTAAAMQRLLSASTMSATVEALRLDRDPEFTGGPSNAVGVAFELLSGSGAAVDAASRAEKTLGGMVEADADRASGTVHLKVTTADGAKSSRIALWLSNMLTSGGNSASAQERAGFRKAYDDAQAELGAFTAKSGEGNVKVAADLQHRVNQLDADLKIAEQRIALAKDKADRLKRAKAEDVLNGSLPAEAVSPALQAERDKYVAEKATLSLLASELGPRHPRLLGQQAVVDGLKDKVAKELARQAQDANAGLKTAVEARKTLNDQRNTLIAQSRDTGVDLAKLTELRDRAEAARSRMEDAVTATASTAPLAAVLKPMHITAVSSGSTLPVHSAIGPALGLALGLAGMVAFRSLRKRPAPLPEMIAPAEQPEPQVDELEQLRDQLASLRDKLQSYGPGHR